jgi:phosphoserine phosphatase
VLWRTATRDRATFDALVADIETAGAKVIPITGAGGPAVKPVVKLRTVDEVLAADPTLAAYLKNAGITKAQFEQHGLQAYLDRLARATG